MTKRSLLWPTFWSAFALVLLLGLGTWQVQRLAWKEGLIAERNDALAAVPVPLPKSLDEARALEFHPVRAAGEFLNDHELDLNAQSLRGDQGFHIVTPFRLADGTMMLIDRGFVPTEKRAPETRAAGEIAGPTTVTGLLRLPEPPGYFTPANEPQRIPGSRSICRRWPRLRASARCCRSTSTPMRPRRWAAGRRAGRPSPICRTTISNMRSLGSVWRRR